MFANPWTDPSTPGNPTAQGTALVEQDAQRNRREDDRDRAGPPQRAHELLELLGPERMETLAGLEEAIRRRTATIGVVGLGYVGLPRIRGFIGAGYRTIGFDTDPIKIAQLQAGQSYIGHISSACIEGWRDTKRFEATDGMQRLCEPDVVLVCVPTPLSESRDPDLSCIEATCEAIAARLRVEQLIVLESTTYPGTTRDVVLPILRRSGLEPGEDFYLAYSPEREDPGNATYTADDIPKLVAGIEPASSYLATALYREVVAEVVPVSTVEVAEAAKLVENTYRAVNIALVNELKVLLDRMGIDVWEVIDAAGTKPFGYQPFYPGPGLGGHCIPIDPFYLGWLARKHGLITRFVELAGEINARMPGYVVDGITTGLNRQGKPVKGSKICILGVAYKKDVDDPRESPAFAIIEQLLRRGAEVSYNDPYIPSLPVMRRHDVPGLESEPLSPEFLAAQDCVVIVTDHSAYDYEQIVEHAPLVVDTRNATKHVRWGRAKILRA